MTQASPTRELDDNDGCHWIEHRAADIRVMRSPFDPRSSGPHAAAARLCRYRSSATAATMINPIKISCT